MKWQDEMPKPENGVGSREEVPTGETGNITTEPKKPTTPTEDKEIETVPVKEGVAQPSEKEPQDRPYKLWLPEKRPHLADLVFALKHTQQQPPKAEAATPLQELKSQTISSIKTRQQKLQERIEATQAVLPQKVYKIKPKEDETKVDKGSAPKKFVRQQSILNVSDDVSEYLKGRAGSIADIGSSVRGAGGEAVSPSVLITEHSLGFPRKYETQFSTSQNVKCSGSIPLNKWREIVKKNKPFFTSIDSEGELENSSTYID